MPGRSWEQVRRPRTVSAAWMSVRNGAFRFLAGFCRAVRRRGRRVLADERRRHLDDGGVIAGGVAADPLRCRGEMRVLLLIPGANALQQLGQPSTKRLVRNV
ncbi:hypothetical protein ACOZ38_29145 [Sphaerisporangium viridialbum]|uniref:hypothetical protein n=1 Tax=Sphaerisporangium viridialbum TaxID=46189 RepID=UPI003C70A31C